MVPAQAKRAALVTNTIAPVASAKPATTSVTLPTPTPTAAAASTVTTCDPTQWHDWHDGQPVEVGCWSHGAFQVWWFGKIDGAPEIMRGKKQYFVKPDKSVDKNIPTGYFPTECLRPVQLELDSDDEDSSSHHHDTGGDCFETLLRSLSNNRFFDLTDAVAPCASEI